MMGGKFLSTAKIGLPTIVSSAVNAQPRNPRRVQRNARPRQSLLSFRTDAFNRPNLAREVLDGFVQRTFEPFLGAET